MTEQTTPTQPSHASRFAADWAIRQSKLVRDGSWLGRTASLIPTYAQLRG